MKRATSRFVTLLFLCLMSPAAVYAQCTTEWTNAAGGNWTNAANWSAGVPGAADDACIILDATYTVTLAVNATVNSLTLGTNTGANTQGLSISSGLTLGSASTVDDDGERDGCSS